MRNRAVKVKVRVTKSVVPPVASPQAGSHVWEWTHVTPIVWIHRQGLLHILGSCDSPKCVAVRQMIHDGSLVKGKDF